MADLDKVSIPDAPISAAVSEKIKYVPPAPPIIGNYTRFKINESGSVKSNQVVISKTTAFVLHFFLGFWGIGDFYCGRMGIGIAKLLTGGGFFIWALIDAFRVLAGSYHPANGYIIK